MDKTYWLTDKDDKGFPYKVLPPGRYTCYECRKQIKYVLCHNNDGELMHRVKPCQNCGCIVVGI